MRSAPTVECEFHHTGLPVDDVPAAVDFYTTRLGFELEFTWGEPVRLAGVNLGEAQIFLEKGLPNPAGCHLYFVVGDADDLYEFQREQGVEVLWDPEDQPYGLRDYAIRDLHGYQLVFGHHTSEPVGDSVASPHTRSQLRHIQELKTKHGIDHDCHASYRVVEEGQSVPDRNLVSISPFLIVEDLQVSISYYIERLGFRLDFQGPAEDPYYARVSRDGIGVMLKTILPDVPPRPNRTRHEWARWDAYVYVLDPDSLFDEFRGRGASFVSDLSFMDEGLWGFEVSDADGYVLAFFHLRDEQAAPKGR